MAQMRIPRYMRVAPDTPPRPLKLTWSSAGTWMSASLAATLIALNARTIRFKNIVFFLTISLLLTGPAQVLQDALLVCQQKFRLKCRVFGLWAKSVSGASSVGAPSGPEKRGR